MQFEERKIKMQRHVDNILKKCFPEPVNIDYLLLDITRNFGVGEKALKRYLDLMVRTKEITVIGNEVRPYERGKDPGEIIKP